MQVHDYYRLLHVQPDAPLEVIRSSYRTLMQRMKVHPDLGGDHRAAALLNEAWSVLRDARKRAAYDAERRDPTPSASRSTHTGKRATVTACHFCGEERRVDAPLRHGDRCHRCESPLLPADRSRMEHGGQRAIRRIRRHHPLTVVTAWPPGRPIAGQTLDISLHGLRFVTAQALERGQLIRIDSDICRAVARVIASDLEADTERRHWLIRAEFLTLEFESALGSFVSETA